MAEKLSWQQEAEDFINNAKQFHLGFLPSEARHPLTMHLDGDFHRSTACGVRTLLKCDRALLPHLQNALNSPEFAELTAAMREARHVIFSGCGATGRLAVLLESSWNEIHPEDRRVLSIMTGGDFALIRSVENFEDYPAVGANQAQDLQVNDQDLLVGITATGETASIVGSAMETVRRGGKVFMLICVPPELAASRLTRCQELYSQPSVKVISMPIGGMALTGSTRMQSSTIEYLIAAAALEAAAGTPGNYAGYFDELLKTLETPQSVENIARAIESEAEIYRRHGLIDYHANDLEVDILSDTTERSPTFMLPPYKYADDAKAPESWAMVRDPGTATEEVWRRILKRSPRCIEWPKERYEASGLTALLKRGMPRIDHASLLQIQLGGEAAGRRGAKVIELDSSADTPLVINGLSIGSAVPQTPLRTFEHLRMKLVMNVISTGTMVLLGRVRGNYMIHVALSNSKLVDRGCRIISELAGVDYRTACYELFRSRAEVAENVSPVAAALERLAQKK